MRCEADRSTRGTPFDGKRYTLHGWVVMPNHVHVLVEPLGRHRLAAVVQGWKSYTAKCANRALGRSGTFWRREYFDRFIRDPDHFERAP